jgi:hypothetical protein
VLVLVQPSVLVLALHHPSVLALPVPLVSVVLSSPLA